MSTYRQLSVVRIEMVRERELAYPADALMSGPNDALHAARAFLEGFDREGFVSIHLSSKHKINGIELVAMGTLNSTLVHPREVFKGAILSNSAAIIVAHNHPSGDPTPSPEDMALTTQLLAAGEILGIRVMDHLVIGDDRHVSLRETSSLWVGHEFHR
jgi:DNA repair protein RadC